MTPLLIVMLAGFGLGGGIIVSALTTRYRDLSYLVALSVQLMMYATPVIYPAAAVPTSYWWLPYLNPLTPIMEGFRRGFLGVGTVTPLQLAGSFGAMLIVLVIGLILFTQVERTFNDTV
jgi:lipopolysaccharide transport system permease protein